MKLPFFALAAALLTASAAAAQTSPNMPTQTQPNTSNPAAVPSGTTPVQSDPKGNVTSSEVFTKGSPNNSDSKMTDKRRMKHKKMKDDGKMKTTM